MTSDLKTESIQAKREWNEIFIARKEKDCTPWKTKRTRQHQLSLVKTDKGNSINWNSFYENQISNGRKLIDNSNYWEGRYCSVTNMISKPFIHLELATKTKIIRSIETTLICQDMGNTERVKWNVNSSQCGRVDGKCFVLFFFSFLLFVCRCSFKNGTTYKHL